jgi:outer membrane immunogenic protein
MFALALAMQPVAAADLPVQPLYKTQVAAPIFDWTGFYVGGSIGYNRHKTKWWDLGPYNPPASTYNLTASSVIFGLHAGYNWHSENFVLGVETDISYSRARERGIWGIDIPVETKAQFLGTTRLRAGVAADRTLFYVTGGVAYSNSKSSWGPVPSGTWSRSGWNLGWVAGGGVEHALSDPRWTIRLEGLYLDFRKYGARSWDPDDYPLDVKYTDLIVRAALNYRY